MTTPRDEAIALLTSAADHLRALREVMVDLRRLGDRAPDLRPLFGIVEAEPPFSLRHERVLEEIDELKAAAAGKTSPRSLRLQAEADAREREQNARLRDEQDYARRNNWYPTKPPERKRR